MDFNVTILPTRCYDSSHRTLINLVEDLYHYTIQADITSPPGELFNAKQGIVKCERQYCFSSKKQWTVLLSFATFCDAECRQCV